MIRDSAFKFLGWVVVAAIFFILGYVVKEEQLRRNMTQQENRLTK